MILSEWDKASYSQCWSWTLKLHHCARIFKFLSYSNEPAKMLGGGICKLICIALDPLASLSLAFARQCHIGGRSSSTSTCAKFRICWMRLGHLVQRVFVVFEVSASLRPSSNCNWSWSLCLTGDDGWVIQWGNISVVHLAAVFPQRHPYLS